MKKQVKKLALSKETLRTLVARDFRDIAGGTLTAATQTSCGARYCYPEPIEASC